jgi:hypothetical protein
MKPRLKSRTFDFRKKERLESAYWRGLIDGLNCNERNGRGPLYRKGYRHGSEARVAIFRQLRVRK